MSLRDEIKQGRAFGSVEQEALLNIQRTAAVLGYAFSEQLKPYGLTPKQYNVLRILRGAGEGGMCRHEIRGRLIAQVPDVTRLLDRLEAASLIERERSGEDRREVKTMITGKGLEMLEELDEPVAAIHRRQFAHMSGEELRTLVQLLETARERV
jgi:DNA-binding MarR family transcriptional regulator